MEWVLDLLRPWLDPLRISVTGKEFALKAASRGVPSGRLAFVGCVDFRRNSRLELPLGSFPIESWQRKGEGSR